MYNFLEKCIRLFKSMIHFPSKDKLIISLKSGYNVFFLLIPRQVNIKKIYIIIYTVLSISYFRNYFTKLYNIYTQRCVI